MGVIIKHSLKNIFSKPLRLLVLLICVIFASFTGLMAIDMSGSIDSLFRGYFMKMLGNMDVIAYNSSNDDIKGIGEEYPISAVGIASAGQFEYSHDPSDYAFSSADQITVESFSDMEGAYELSILPETVVVDDETCVVSQKYAEAYDVKEGDTITIETMDKQEIELTVAKVLNISNTLIKGECIIVSNDILRRVSCVKELNYSIWMIDAKVDSDSQAIVDTIKNNNPRAEVESITAMFEEDNDLQSPLHHLIPSGHLRYHLSCREDRKREDVSHRNLKEPGCKPGQDRSYPPGRKRPLCSNRRHYRLRPLFGSKTHYVQHGICHQRHGRYRPPVTYASYSGLYLFGSCLRRSARRMRISSV